MVIKKYLIRAPKTHSFPCVSNQHLAVAATAIWPGYPPELPTIDDQLPTIDDRNASFCRQQGSRREFLSEGAGDEWQAPVGRGSGGVRGGAS